jgi:ketosteroid isomerase-like protein
VQRVLEGYAAFNRGDIEGALEGFGEDMEWIGPDLLPDPGPFRGPAGIRRFWDMWHETFQDFRIEIVQVHDLEDHVVVMTRVHGTGRDSGAAVSTPAFPQVWTFSGEQIVRMEMFQGEEAAREAIGKDWR